jgi:hypothetical protein
MKAKGQNRPFGKKQTGDTKYVQFPLPCTVLRLNYVYCARDAKVLAKSANYVDSLQQAIAPIFSHRL